MVSERIEPFLSQLNRKSTNRGALVNIGTDIDCRILRFGKEIATARAAEYSSIRLPKGKHKLAFVEVTEGLERYECMLDIKDIEYEDYIEVKLLDQYNTRKAAELAEKKAKEEAERKAREEAERKSREEVARRAKEVAEFKALNIEMVYVSGGTFTMGGTSEQGSDAQVWEKPTHSVTVSDFYIGKYEVTQAQWRAVMGSNPSYFTGDNNPVEQVSWNDIQEFIRKLNAQTGKNFRLSTEAEWEYAARGGNKSKGYKFSGSNTIDDVAWYDGNSSSKTHSVGTKQPNELGIYDMSGNVWEWCQDWYGDYSSSSQTNPTGPSSGSYRVLRGGSWISNAGLCRVSYRDGISPGNSGYGIGFRLACSPE